MKKIAILAATVLFVGSIGMSTAFACHSHGGPTHCHGDHGRGGGGHHRGGHHRGGHGGHTIYDLVAADLINKTGNAMIDRIFYGPPPQQSYQYQQPAAPTADECFKNVAAGYFDEYGNFVQTGTRRIQIQCR